MGGKSFLLLNDVLIHLVYRVSLDLREHLECREKWYGFCDNVTRPFCYKL